ncbi:hypothetical protein PY093_01920 [Cytobacillus sp. S13-E01]|uniref:hypothetical protein n=1 Tax=Cytobacillus sp. S13-E01 TaxID=3031326 RepID=UPI0023D8C80E|nr:hypothetical protein [Cytobacillus sp. S13-E01]MDF0725467.1 hypothetical protein [Cytobacillus sp. S13-E01]
MKELTLAVKINQEGFNNNVEDQSTFGGSFDENMNFTMNQLAVRMDILARAIGKRLEEIYRLLESDVGVV